ncbi:hypothetical protein RIF29_36293 [Crotalaria pallida]|uniref:Uncharacterized protein n=1 Tax=Crotalaria pallida TaxID=3830 RepID=A0AAN9EGI8_CROPI
MINKVIIPATASWCANSQPLRTKLEKFGRTRTRYSIGFRVLSAINRAITHTYIIPSSVCLDLTTHLPHLLSFLSLYLTVTPDL